MQQLLNSMRALAINLVLQLDQQRQHRLFHVRLSHQLHHLPQRFLRQLHLKMVRFLSHLVQVTIHSLLQIQHRFQVQFLAHLVPEIIHSHQQ